MSLLLAIAGSRMFQRQPKMPDATGATNPTLGIIAIPLVATVEGLPQGATSKVQFTLKNVGQRTVRVHSVGTSCGCSLAEPIANEIIRPAKTEFLFISATPPSFGSRKVHVVVKLIDLEDASHAEAIHLDLNLIGKLLAPTRIYEVPTIVEMTGATGRQAVRQIQFKTVEENVDHMWITGLSSTSAKIQAEIVDCSSIATSTGSVQRTYDCRLTAEVPQKADEILAGTIRLMSGVRAVDCEFRAVVRRRVALGMFPSVLKIPVNAVSETTRSVIVHAIDATEVESLRRL